MMTISQLSLGLIADAIVVTALALNFIYMFRVARRLKTLRSGSSEMKALLEDFSRHVDRSQQALGDLRAVADGAGANLRADIEAAERMHQDLIFALKACEGISSRMEALRNDGRERLSNLTENAQREPVVSREPAAPAPVERSAGTTRRDRAQNAPDPVKAAARQQRYASAAAPEPPADVMAGAAAPTFDPAPAQADTLAAPVRPAQWRKMETAAEHTAPSIPQPFATPGSGAETGDEPQRGAALKQFLMSMRNKETG